LTPLAARERLRLAAAIRFDAQRVGGRLVAVSSACRSILRRGQTYLDFWVDHGGDMLPSVCKRHMVTHRSFLLAVLKLPAVTRESYSARSRTAVQWRTGVTATVAGLTVEPRVHKRTDTNAARGKS
jgi:hypothetical protein